MSFLLLKMFVAGLGLFQEVGSLFLSARMNGELARLGIAAPKDEDWLDDDPKMFFGDTKCSFCGAEKTFVFAAPKVDGFGVAKMVVFAFAAAAPNDDVFALPNADCDANAVVGGLKSDGVAAASAGALPKLSIGLVFVLAAAKEGDVFGASKMKALPNVSLPFWSSASIDSRLNKPF